MSHFTLNVEKDPSIPPATKGSYLHVLHIKMCITYILLHANLSQI